MPQRILGIDIGSYSVKMAIIERGFRSFAFTEFYERRIQYNELLSPEESTAIAIQGLVDDHNLHWDSVCAGFPAQRVTSRLITFPFSSSKKIDQTVNFEIESFIPFTMEDIVVDYTTVWQTKDASRVMVVYVQKKELAKELTLLGQVNIDPRVIGIEGVELLSLVTMGMVPPEGAYAIIDIGHEKATITICNGRNLSYIRAISVAGKAVTQTISENLSVPFDEAEKMKIEMGRVSLPGEDSPADDITKKVSESIKTVLDEFLLHLRQTFFTFRESESSSVEGIYLCGGTSRIPGIDRYISDALKLNVTYLNCSEFHFSRLDRGEAHRHIIPQALALALRGAAGSSVNLDLRSGEFAFKGDVEQLGGSVKKVGFLIGLIIFLGLINFTAKYYSLGKEVDAMKSDMVKLVTQSVQGVSARQLKGPKETVNAIRGKENEMNERINQIRSVMGTSPLDVLKDISSRMPPRDQLKVDVQELNITGNRITVAGRVDDFKAVDVFKEALEKVPTPFINVATSDVSKGVKGEVKFKLSMDVAGEEKPEVKKEEDKGGKRPKAKAKDEEL